MGYAHKLSEDKLLVLAPTLEALEALAEGESLMLSDSPKNLDLVRLDLYTWLAETNQKALYRLRRLSSRELLVQRVSLYAPKIISTQSSVKDLVVDELLSLSLEEVQLTLSHRVSQNRLSLAESEAALREWRRITECPS